LSVKVFWFKENYFGIKSSPAADHGALVTIMCSKSTSKYANKNCLKEWTNLILLLSKLN